MISSLRESYPTILIQRSSEDPHYFVLNKKASEVINSSQERTFQNSVRRLCKHRGTGKLPADAGRQTSAPHSSLQDY